MRTSNLAIACIAIAGACNVSPVPIAPLAEAPFDSALLGVWEAPDADSYGDTATMTILEYRTPEYYIEIVNEADLASQGDFNLFDVVRARAFITRIGDVTFMNADELTGNPRGYTFYRYSIAGDTLIVTGVAEASQKFTSSQELRAFLASNLDTDSLYNDTVRFVKAKPIKKKFP